MLAVVLASVRLVAALVVAALVLLVVAVMGTTPSSPGLCVGVVWLYVGCIVCVAMRMATPSKHQRPRGLRGLSGEPEASARSNNNCAQ